MWLRYRCRKVQLIPPSTPLEVIGDIVQKRIDITEKEKKRAHTLKVLSDFDAWRVRSENDMH